MAGESYRISRNDQEAVRRIYKDHVHSCTAHNWGVHDERHPDPTTKWARSKTLVDEWLIAHGADGPPGPDEEGEMVMIQW